MILKRLGISSNLCKDPSMKLVFWNPLLLGWLKINSDGLVISSRFASYGGVLEIIEVLSKTVLLIRLLLE